jgi:nucleoside-diphosphate-sugar epimerase
VKDVALANLAAAECRAGAISGLAFNIGTGRSLSVSELASALGTIFPATPEACQVPGRRGEIKHSSADIKQAHAVLSWQSSIRFEDGLAELAKK